MKNIYFVLIIITSISLNKVFAEGHSLKQSQSFQNPHQNGHSREIATEHNKNGNSNPISFELPPSPGNSQMGFGPGNKAPNVKAKIPAKR